MKKRTTDERTRKDKRGENRTEHDREDKTMITKTVRDRTYGHGWGSAAEQSIFIYHISCISPSEHVILM
jgi:hypothetical protein